MPKRTVRAAGLGVPYDFSLIPASGFCSGRRRRAHTASCAGQRRFASRTVLALGIRYVGLTYCDTPMPKRAARAAGCGVPVRFSAHPQWVDTAPGAAFTTLLCQRRPPGRPALATLQDLPRIPNGQQKAKHAARPAGRQDGCNGARRGGALGGAGRR